MLLMLVACQGEDPLALSGGNAIRSEDRVAMQVSAYHKGSGDAEDVCECADSIVVETAGDDEAWVEVPDVTVDCEEPPLVDAVLVADNSGSEDGHLDDIQDALEGFVHRLLAREHDDRLGLVRVSTEAEEMIGLSSDEDELDAAIGELHIANGWTALWDGVRLANEVLEADALGAGDEGAACYAGTYPTVVVFTDGAENNSADEHDTIYGGDGIDTTLDDLEALDVGGVPTLVHTVGVGDEVDEDGLTELAEATGGSYRAIASYGGLTGALHSAAAQISTQVPLCFTPAAETDTQARITITVKDKKDTETVTLVLPLPG